MVVWGAESVTGMGEEWGQRFPMPEWIGWMDWMDGNESTPHSYLAWGGQSWPGWMWMNGGPSQPPASIYKMRQHDGAESADGRFGGLGPG